MARFYQPVAINDEEPETYFLLEQLSNGQSFISRVMTARSIRIIAGTNFRRIESRVMLFTLIAAGSLARDQTLSFGSPNSDLKDVAWQQMPPLPPAPGQPVQAGVAGAFVGVSANALLVAGGANYPLPRVEGGPKIYHRDVYILDQTADGAMQWRVDPSFNLPQARGYGGSITTTEGLVCIGGSDNAQSTTSVLLLRWNPASETLTSEAWPSLPEPAVDIAATLIGKKIFVAGGKSALSGRDNRSTRNFWMLDTSLRHRAGEFYWRRLPPLPGPPRSKAILVAQSVHGVEKLFLFSGRTEEPGKATQFLTDTHVYDLARGRWDELRPVASGLSEGTQGRSVMVGTGVALPSGAIAIFGGSDGNLYDVSDEMNRHIATAQAELDAATNPQQRADLARKLAVHAEARKQFVTKFPGFSRDVLLYQPEADRWQKVGEFPSLPPVTTTAVVWNGRILIPSGEIAPGVRTSTVWSATITR